MGIIDRSEDKQPEEESGGGIISRRGAGGNDGGHHHDHDGGSNLVPIFIGVIAVCVLIAGGAAAYFILNGTGAPGTSNTIVTKTEPIADLANVSLEIDKITRISGMVDLLQRKIDQNKQALETATNRRDTLLIDTMRLALAQNQLDLAETQEDLVTSVSSVHRAFLQDNGRVTSIVEKSINQKTESYQKNQVKVLNKILKIIQTVPEGENSRTEIEDKLGVLPTE